MLFQVGFLIGVRHNNNIVAGIESISGASIKVCNLTTNFQVFLVYFYHMLHEA